MATVRDVGRLVLYLCSQYPHSPVAKIAAGEAEVDKLQFLIKAWHDILHDLPFEAIEAAAQELINTGREFMPNSGQVRQKAFDLMEDGDAPPEPMEAWGQVMRAFSVPPAWRELHPLVEQAVEYLGGMAHLGRQPIEMEAATRARFIQAYETLQKRRREEQRMLPQVREAIQQLAESKRLRLEGGDDATG